jgi:hypothetical protein
MPRRVIAPLADNFITDALNCNDKRTVTGFSKMWINATVSRIGLHTLTCDIDACAGGVSAWYN